MANNYFLSNFTLNKSKNEIMDSNEKINGWFSDKVSNKIDYTPFRLHRDNPQAAELMF